MGNIWRCFFDAKKIAKEQVHIATIIFTVEVIAEMNYNSKYNENYELHVAYNAYLMSGDLSRINGFKWKVVAQ